MVDAVPQNLVDELRSGFLKELKEKSENCIHPTDLERFQKDDHWLKRFIAHNENNLELAQKMVWSCFFWRQQFGVNDINDTNIRNDLIIKGEFFPHGKDIDGKTLLIFKSKMHSKGAAPMADIKRCVVYWFERIERMTKGEPISIFFDMEGCGLSNMDLELTKYLIGLFKDYYPYFLNYIIIYEMPWILNAAFKIVKSWLPEKAIEKLKMVGKKDLNNFVPKYEALICWGGFNSYTFTFIPEEFHSSETTNNNGQISIRKVHFVDGCSMPEQAPSSVPPEPKDGPLSVTPSSIITFVRDGNNELVSTLELFNDSDINSQIIFKLKTTSPEKFRVKPSTGCLKSGAKETITVTLLPGFQLGGLSKDKFLVMSSIIEDKDMPNLDIAEFWKGTNNTNKKIFHTRLRCVQSGEVQKNGNVVLNHHNNLLLSSGDGDWNQQLMKLTNIIGEIRDNQVEIKKNFKFIQHLQYLIIILLGVYLFIYVLFKSAKADDLNSSDSHYCRNQNNLI